MVVLTQRALHDVLISSGIPCAMPEFKGRFECSLADLTEGKNASNVRIVVE